MKYIHTWLFLFSKKSLLKVALLFLCIIIPLAGAQVVTTINKEELLKEAEDLYKKGNWEDAYIKIKPILPFSKAQISKYPISLQIQNSLIEYGNKYLLAYDYTNALDYYDRALTIVCEKNLIAQKEAIINEINTPKVIVEGELMNITADSISDSQPVIKNTYLANRTLKDKITFIQGNPLRIKFLWSEELQNLKFELVNNKGKLVSKTNAFKLQATPIDEQNKKNIWYGLLTTYIDQKADMYKLNIEGITNDTKHLIWHCTVEIINKSFPECIIPLNEKLTNLVTKPDPIKIEEAKYYQEVTSTFNPDAQYHTDYFILPLENAKITTQFGEKTIFTYNTGKKIISTHKGIDYAKPVGTPIKAMGNGKVVLARNRIISGLSVVIEHMPGVFTTYFHLSKLLVKEGEMVSMSQIIGEVGNTGLSTGAHLHMALDICGMPVNPEFFIDNKIIFN